MVALVILMTTVPAVQMPLNTTPLAAQQWARGVAGAVLAMAWIDARNWLRVAAS